MKTWFSSNYANTNSSLKIAKSRVILAISMFVAFSALLIARLVYVMVFNNHNIIKNFNDSFHFAVCRADIVDRNDVIVATSLPTVSSYAVPYEIIDKKDASEKLSKIFPDLKYENLFEKLSGEKKFIWIKRNLSPHQQQLVLEQGIPGVYFLKTERRVYPDKNLLSHVIGGTDIDNVGIAGVEKVFDEELTNSSSPLKLSLDLRVQYAAREELEKGIEEFSAVAGAVIVMDIKTGEIIALSVLPDFDPNKNANPDDKNRFNLATSSAIEPGSSAKIFNTAMALDSGKISPFTMFDARFPIKIGRFTVHDFKGKGAFLSVEEILKYSSNIGSAKIALFLGAQHQKKFFEKVGLLDKISCELSESQKPLYPKKWTEVSAITISYGHSIALSPLQMITVCSGMLNNGYLNKPTILKRNAPSIGKKIISSKTSKQLQALLRIDVLEGTNKFANVEGYLVGGKTGTAEKLKNGKYVKNANYTSFVGAFPMTDPKYNIYIILDEPKATSKTYGYATAGWNAAPIASRIIKRIGPILNVTIHEGKEPDWHAILKDIK